MVFCGFPDEAERLAILQAAARKLPLAADVDFAAIAQVTANFTGGQAELLAAFQLSPGCCTCCCCPAALLLLLVMGVTAETAWQAHTRGNLGTAACQQRVQLSVLGCNVLARV
jgi:hypothetical protein